ncbi:MAG: hypothetical protein ACOX7C_07150 [Brevefilum sp.]
MPDLHSPVGATLSGCPDLNGVYIVGGHGSIPLQGTGSASRRSIPT